MKAPAVYEGIDLGNHRLTLTLLAVVAIVQGLTEFLPVSSSGHLVLLPAVTGWTDQGLVIDIAVHVGTLGAVVVYLRRDIGRMLHGLLQPGKPDPEIRLLGQTIAASVPTIAVGGLIFVLAGDLLRSAVVVGWSTLLFGALLYLADRYSPATGRLEELTWGGALLIGAAQILALIPGASRAGVTITAARALGFERTAAARFSMLMSIPVIAAAGGAGAWKLAASGTVGSFAESIAAAGFAFAAALVAIRLMMGWIRRASFAPFALYRLVLGAAILAWAYG